MNEKIGDGRRPNSVNEEEKNAADALDTLRKKALDQGLSNQQTLNLLQTQQLKANQALERALL